MATTARAARSRIPSMRTPVEASTDTKPSIWTRIKTAAKNAAGAIKRGVVTAAKTVAKPFKAVARKMKPTVQSVIMRCAPFVTRFWRRALRPLLQGSLIGLGALVLLVWAIYAPVATVLILAVGGLVFLALAEGVEKLEQRAAVGDRFATVTLKTFEGFAQVGRVLLYLFAALDMVALMLAAPAYAIFVAVFLPFAYVVSTDAQPLEAPAYSEIRISRDEHADVRTAEADAPHGNYLRAKGTEELWGTEHDVDPATFVIHDEADEGRALDVMAPCHACGTTAPGMRSSITVEGPVETQGLCSSCFDAQCEADALRFTGVSLKARHVRIPLLQEGVEASPEYIASKTNPEEMRWLITARWRMRDNTEYAREWSLLDNGDVVGTVIYDRHTRMYDAEALGVALKSERHEAAAKRLVKDIVMDARNSLERALEKGEEKPEVLAKVFEGAFSGKKA